jgi:hypothetical protein
VINLWVKICLGSLFQGSVHDQMDWLLWTCGGTSWWNRMVEQNSTIPFKGISQWPKISHQALPLKKFVPLPNTTILRIKAF